MKRLTALCLVGSAAIGALLFGAPPASAAASNLTVARSPDQYDGVIPGGGGTLQFSIGESSPDVRLTVDLPSAAALVDVARTDGRTDIPYTDCATTAATTVCDLGALTGTKLRIDVNFSVSVNAAIGSHLRVGADAEPVSDPDADPADNTVAADFTVFPQAHRTVSVSPNQPTTLIQATTKTFHASYTNVGADPITHEVATFRLSAVTAAGVASAGIVTFGSFASTAVRVAVSSLGDPQSATWSIGTLAPGATVSMDIPVTALAASGAGGLTWSDSSDGDRSNAGTAQPLIELAVVAASTSPGAPAPILAATGSRTGPLAILGLSLLITGVACLLAGRRRPARRQHPEK